ncbi:hypothetical protein ACIF9R_01500 [Streptomyces sp. NPDC086080]|uniref:hypothetical protein n=1 Tax=Streptomyces sp. NPDC086080 TaxID=3365748 RepID=UPI0037D31071
MRVAVTGGKASTTGRGQGHLGAVRRSRSRPGRHRLAPATVADTPRKAEREAYARPNGRPLNLAHLRP